MDQKDWLIYQHTSPSGKSYIGQTNDYRRRCNSHKNATGGCRAFSNAVKKYGWENMTSTILMKDLSVDEANYWEEFFICKHSTIYPAGYNLTSGGKNKVPNEETRKIWSDQRRGRTLSEETKRKAQETKRITGGNIKTPEWLDNIAKARANSTNIVSDETRKRMSESAKKRQPPTEETLKKLQLAANKKKGIPRSEEVIRKITETKRKRIYGKKIMINNIIYESLTRASIHYSIHVSTVFTRIRSNAFPHWQYIQ